MRGDEIAEAIHKSTKVDSSFYGLLKKLRLRLALWIATPQLTQWLAMTDKRQKCKKWILVGKAVFENTILRVAVLLVGLFKDFRGELDLGSAVPLKSLKSPLWIPKTESLIRGF